MKKLLIISLFFIACNGGFESTHEVHYSPDGKDSIAYVWYFDGRQFNNAVMNYAQFEVLYNEGGYEAVYDYYCDHQLPRYWEKKYSKYKALNDR